MSLRVSYSVFPLLLALSIAACSPASKDKEEKSTGAASSAAPASIQGQGIEGAAKTLMGPDAKVTQVSDSVIPGLKEVIINGQVFYADPDGKYLMMGEIMQVEGRVNITGQTRDTLRLDVMKELNPKDAIIYKAKGETKHVLNVFTDVECGYCRKFHSEIDQYNAKGIEIRYYPWPRSGAVGPVYEEMVSVWCASDKKAALTSAKNGTPPPSKTCENPVAKYYDLGTKMGIQGTPAVFTEKGKQVGGYVPPDHILTAIEPPVAPPSSAPVSVPGTAGM